MMSSESARRKRDDELDRLRVGYGCAERGGAMRSASTAPSTAQADAEPATGAVVGEFGVMTKDTCDDIARRGSSAVESSSGTLRERCRGARAMVAWRA